jgi:hypothetical protein
MEVKREKMLFFYKQAARISALQTFEIRGSNEFFFLSPVVK